MAPTPILLAAERARASGITLADNESAFRENSATIVMPSAEAAFLNPVQEFNRDLSTLAIRTWSERLDAEKKARFVKAAERKAASASKGKGKRKEVKGANGSSIVDEAAAEQPDAKKARIDENGNGVTTSTVTESEASVADAAVSAEASSGSTVVPDRQKTSTAATSSHFSKHSVPQVFVAFDTPRKFRFCDGYWQTIFRHLQLRL